jgi:Protein of unknown function (DUF3168)
MDFQAGIRSRLINDVALSAAVGTRIDWGERKQGATLPAIVLTTVSDPRPANLKDYEAVRSTLIQVDVFALTFASALVISRAVISALKTPTTVSGKKFGACFVDGQRDSVEPLGTANVHRQSIDLNIWHQGD